MKTCLKKTLGKAFVTFEELQTVLCEIEMAITNRPLAYVSDDDLDNKDSRIPKQGFVLKHVTPEWPRANRTVERFNICWYA